MRAYPQCQVSRQGHPGQRARQGVVADERGDGGRRTALDVAECHRAHRRARVERRLERARRNSPPGAEHQVVRSGNTATEWPARSRAAISATLCGRPRRADRSMNSVSCRFASGPSAGQFATSLLARKAVQQPDHVQPRDVVGDDQRAALTGGAQPVDVGVEPNVQRSEYAPGARGVPQRACEGHAPQHTFHPAHRLVQVDDAARSAR
ncbi:MAG: hypothetical protein ACRDQ7_03805 [Haloechinothrix sp.]